MAAFPSLLIRAHSLVPQGAFAAAQAVYLNPDPGQIQELDTLLQSAKVGVVAHFYMDAELQGLLGACSWPHIEVADSLLMADHAVKMAEAGIQNILVLGVDFMSENVRAVLDAAGFPHIGVFRVATQEIGCSLAESAEARAYGAWLQRAARSQNPLHVVYINTSLEVKAHSHNVVPTITCTSSNVVKTILQAAAQIPKVSLWYGPDTYMGANLQDLLGQLAHMDKAEIRAIHPAHTPATVRALLGRFEYFRQGNCVVHHMFGAAVVEKVRTEHPDAFYTAHLEVPGEMFALAAEAQTKGRGVVGSTSNILQFIGDQVTQQVQVGTGATLSFVLGTEAGMITAIVKKVQAQLRGSGRDDITVEIIFPVASEAVAQDDTFGVVPGVAGGEGCSTAGGCATCPYMKMNSIEGLMDVAELVERGDSERLSAYHPKAYTNKIAGKTAAELGGEPILHMRHFQQTGSLSVGLVDLVTGRNI